MFFCHNNKRQNITSVIFSQQPPRLCLRPLKDFLAGTPPFKGPWLTLRIASGIRDIQGHRQVFRARRRGPMMTRSRTIDANLDCAFVESPPPFYDPPDFFSENGGGEKRLTYGNMWGNLFFQPISTSVFFFSLPSCRREVSGRLRGRPTFRVLWDNFEHWRALQIGSEMLRRQGNL